MEDATILFKQRNAKIRIGPQGGEAGEKPTVLVLRGGPSAEREVSLASGRGVVGGLIEQGYQVLEGDIWPEDVSVLEKGGFDIVFPVLHGTFGEDGKLQAILEERGLNFAGSTSASSRRAMNKYEAKKAFTEAGLLTPQAELIEAALEKRLGAREFDLLIERALEAIAVPCVVKPNEQGSSIGVSICHNEEQAWDAIKGALRRYGDCLLERMICGRELTVGILGDRSLPVIQVRPAAGFYDYESKYEDDNTQYIFDIDLPEQVRQEVGSDGRRAFEALGCRDFGRVDMIVDDLGRDFILEVNTIPGFTSHSLLPKAAGRAGISMGQLCEQIVQMAQRRTILKV